MGLSVSPDGEPRGSHPPAATPGQIHGFRIGVEQEGSTLRLRLTGELDWGCIGQVEAALERASQAGIEQVVFDLQQLEFLDSAGLRTILRANDRSKVEPFELIVVRPRGLANRVFTLTRASRQLTLVDDIATDARG